jgi:hypothetical protein
MVNPIRRPPPPQAVAGLNLNASSGVAFAAWCGGDVLPGAGLRPQGACKRELTKCRSQKEAAFGTSCGGHVCARLRLGLSKKGAMGRLLGFAQFLQQVGITTLFVTARLGADMLFLRGWSWTRSALSNRGGRPRRLVLCTMMRFDLVSPFP